MIQKVKWKDWFINNKNAITDPEHPDYEKFWDSEEERCKDGVTIDGVYFPGKLYWHLNYWTIDLDYVDDQGRPQHREDRPTFRDLEWKIFNEIDRAERGEGKGQKGLSIIGCRRLSKSYTISSYLAHGITFDKNSENVLVGVSSADIQVTMDKLQNGLANLPEAFKWTPVKKKGDQQITYGVEDKKGNKKFFSHLMIRNLDGGNNKELLAGLKPRKLVIEEAAKNSFAESFQAATPAFTTPFGWTCSPILIACVCKGTKVQTSDGLTKNIEDVVIGDSLLGYDGKKSCINKVKIINKPIQKECVRITTTGGNILECSKDHPILAWDRKVRLHRGRTYDVKGFSFIEAGNLKFKDQVAFIKETPNFGEYKESHARLIGLFLGDGHFRGGALCIDDDNIREFIKENYTSSDTLEFRMRNGTLYSSVHVGGVMSLFKDYGMFHMHSEQKFIPEFFSFCDKKTISELIAGLYDADGNVNHSDKKEVTRIVLTNISQRLLLDVKYLLLKFGIQSSLYKENRNTDPGEGYEGQKKYIYRLYVATEDSVELFKKNIPLLHSKKIESLNKFKKKSTRGVKKAYFKSKGTVHDKNSLPDDTEMEGYKFEMVKTVEDIGLQDVYNLNVGGTHTYIANGIITHNTGGEVEKGKDAKKVFFNPRMYNMLAYPDAKVPGRETGLFLGNEWRMDAKVETTLDKYLGIESKELSKIKIQVSDKEKAAQVREEILETKRADRTAFFKEKMYYPLDADEIFLSQSMSIFDKLLLKAQLDKLEENEIKGTYVELEENTLTGKINHRVSNKMPVENFPVEPEDNKDAPIVVYEFPQHDPPSGLYVIGIDSYRHGQAHYSTSLGAVYVFKRMHDINSNTFQDMIVASYVARPEDKKVWENQARLLIKWYNAIAMVENDEISFIDYMIGKNEDYLLADVPDWFKVLQPNSTQKRKKGLSRASAAVRNYLHGVMKNYIEEVLIDEVKDESGKILQKKVFGASRILDKVLVKELLEYNEEGNFDRVVAAEIALAYAKKLDPLYGIIGKKVSAGEALKMRSEKREPRKMFSTSRSFYGGRKRKSLFR